MEATGPNAEQIAYWNDAAAAKWVSQQETLDTQLAAFGEAAATALQLQPGESVLDVGCGCGGTTLALVAAVGASGKVLGVDISAPMLQRARERDAAAGLSSLQFQTADAQTHRFPPAAFDALFSRFGVMFFADPTAAFTNLRHAVRPRGRVAFACWQALQANPWMAIPMAAVAQVVPLSPPASPDAPGPFAFADRDRVQRILQNAGFVDVQLAPFSPRMTLGGSTSLAGAVDFLLQLGPAAAALRDADAEARSRARTAVSEAIAPYLGPTGVVMGSAAWIVTARNA